ncbi:MAG: Stp1/IreP family PP2C-type Ser/Thr phosphatase [Gammaproteobacteria bacterium]|nr:Stp1/IreP family PP2C-type Ser/Thr phosphatase [Gammaproteobacteria bacterium]NIR81842.1 Stp1/IreP family PP2C-type Ser/Thr phosphatase [Gammaproteobacteria bacterium]NIR88674.1 Stp1/IreP family PP2C-type Ser/Thr phosphatase [Gammaproteobacteria bacterium]NIU02950.1 Stp1/IreP family PP2C-type Ser/Thr phosphatase [Gammaproteobacteria bacterium]NIV50471.1 Stp1/IreP family PP2C-type Ser/Thr phosphatase [Gammaproteobacteria bacterium]
MNVDGALQIVALTDVGKARDHNEDSVASDAALGLAVLADGMGGYRGGKVASELAVSMLIDEVRAGLAGLRPDQLDEGAGWSRETLLMKSAIEKTNSAIHQQAEHQPRCQGMGTTLVAGMFYDNRVTVAHVGDSRFYRARGEELRRLTVDHSLLQELIDKGFYTAEEARHSLNRNLVTRAIGIDSAVTPDLVEETVLPGDVYLLCSDGLSDEVQDEEILSTLSRYSGNPQKAAETLVQMANEKGGSDNISVIVVRTLRPFPARKSWYSRVVDWF